MMEGGMAPQTPSNRARVRIDSTLNSMQKPEDVNYREAETPDVSCGNCMNFDGAHSCAAVAGEIDSAATCDLHDPGGMPAPPQEASLS